MLNNKLRVVFRKLEQVSKSIFHKLINLIQTFKTLPFK